MKRKPKKDDQNNVEKAYLILLEAIGSHPEIEPALWASGCWSVLINGYLASGLELKEFEADWKGAFEFYKSRLKNDH